MPPTVTLAGLRGCGALRRAWLGILAALACLVSGPGLNAQEGPSAQRAVTVGLYVSPPFVMEDGGQFFELWASSTLYARHSCSRWPSSQSS
jgi:hypothetical protein